MRTRELIRKIKDILSNKNNQTIDRGLLEEIKKNKKVIDFLDQQPERWKELFDHCEQSVVSDFINLVVEQSALFQYCLDRLTLKLEKISFPN